MTPVNTRRSSVRSLAAAAAVASAWLVTSLAGAQQQGASEQRSGKQTERKDDPSSKAKSDQARRAATSADVDQIAANPDAYVGKTVKVRGEVEEILGARAFTLDEDSLAATTDVLVVMPESAPALGQNANVTVTGPVALFSRTQFAREHDGFDLDPDVAVLYESRPVIVARSVRGSQNRELLAARSGSDIAQGAQPARDEARPVQLSPGHIAREPAKYYGRRVAVEGEIEDVFGRGVFTLDEDALFAGPDVLVITTSPAAAVTDGADVEVEGTLRPFRWAEVRRDFDWLELDNDVVVALEDRPVIVADTVMRETEGRPARRPAKPAGRQAQ